MITPELVQETRDELIARHRLRILNRFNTFKDEKGMKDVVLCEAQDMGRVIVRVGESRPSGFFLDGYTGSAIQIPRCIERGTGECPYEIEQWIEGVMAADVNTEKSYGCITSDVCEQLIRAFWEFQEVGTHVLLPTFSVKEKIQKHFDSATQFLTDPSRAEAMIHTHTAFWDGTFPSKWKFALDNLICTPQGKIALIDNARAGLRCFGYDLGWIIWPLWVGMDTSEYAHPQGQTEYLEWMLKRIEAYRPAELVLPSVGLRGAFWLVVFERAIGSLFDVAQNTEHLVGGGLDAKGDPSRREAHIHFLNAICHDAMQRIEKI